MNEQILLTPAEAAERLSVGRTILYELMREGLISSVKIGRSRRIPMHSLLSYVDSLEKQDSIEQ